MLRAARIAPSVVIAELERSAKNMRLLLPILLFVASVHAHELQGTVTRGDVTASIPRLPIPFDASRPIAEGRLFELWIGEDTVLLIYVKQYGKKIILKDALPNENFRVWCVEAPSRLTLPDGLRAAKLDEISSISGIEELKGSFDLSWKSDLDYSLYLDAKGERQKFYFIGHLFGNPKNKALK